MNKVKFLIGLLIFAVMPLFLTANTTVNGQEQISLFKTDIILDDQGYATVTETISYNFSNEQRHGIFRDIPTVYNVTDTSGYVAPVEVISVSRGNNPEPFEQITDDSYYQRLKIGDANTTISGTHIYVIEYRLGPLVISSDDGFEIFRFDVPGTGWDVPVSEVKVSLTSSKTPVNTTCYQGFLGVLDQDCTVDSNNSFSSSRLLETGETITVEAAYEAGNFETIAREIELKYRNVQFYGSTSNPPSPLFRIAFALIPTTLFGLFGLRPALGYFAYQRRKKAELVIAQYDPPKDMEPAELGLLVDNSSSGAELSATIIQFAVKGYIKIVQTAEKKWYRNASYDLVKLKPADGQLKPYQQELLDSLFADGGVDLLDVIASLSGKNDSAGEQKSTVNTKDLAKSTVFQKANIEFHKTLKENLQELGFYKKLNIFSLSLASRMTEEGYKKWAEVEGFREFLKLTEADRLAFHNAPEKKPEQFSEYLPHAIALGVEKQWAKQFKDLDVRVDDWYQGASAYNTLAITDLASSLSQGLGAVAQSANSNSGSSGIGGGSSGGGFGGGGGGSW